MKKILIIDDSPFMTQMFSLRLHSEGFEPLIAGDGETGIKMAEINNPSGILLDIAPPGIDGWEVLKRLKSAEVTKNIPTVILTNSKGGSDDVSKAREMGAVDYLMKVGQSVDEIIGTIKKYF
jgi:DNA-binding response OmpR family regulator